MDKPNRATERGESTYPEGECEAEFHLRLCARRLTTGHLQFRWRVEAIHNVLQTGDNSEGSFGPFQLPHEAGQEVAAAVRTWMKSSLAFKPPDFEPDDDHAGDVQLTLRDFLRD